MRLLILVSVALVACSGLTSPPPAMRATTVDAGGSVGEPDALTPDTQALSFDTGKQDTQPIADALPPESYTGDTGTFRRVGDAQVAIVVDAEPMQKPDTMPDVETRWPSCSSAKVMSDGMACAEAGYWPGTKYGCNDQCQDYTTAAMLVPAAPCFTYAKGNPSGSAWTSWSGNVICVPIGTCKKFCTDPIN
jgi:hypothetical protein